MNDIPNRKTGERLWRDVRADVMRRLESAYLLLPYEERVRIAEHAAREVQDLAATVWADRRRRSGA